MSDLLDIKPHQVTSSPLDKVWLFYGEPGTRKTSIAVGNTEQTLLLAFEVGYKFIPGVYAKNITSWVNLKQIVRQLDDSKVSDKYKIIAIDTIGLAYKACVSYVCSQKGVDDIGEIPYGRGYRMAKDEFEKVINSIPQKGYGLNMVAHSDELNDEKNGVSVKVDIDKRPSSVIKGLADFIFYSRKEVKDNSETNEMTVYAYAETTNPNIEVKKRARFFPKRIEFTYKNILSALKGAIAEQDEFYGTKSIAEPDFDIYSEEEIDFNQLREDVINLANELLDNKKAYNITEKTITNQLPHTRISEATKNDTAVLIALKDKLLDIKKGLQ